MTTRGSSARSVAALFAGALLLFTTAGRAAPPGEASPLRPSSSSPIGPGAVSVAGAESSVAGAAAPGHRASTAGRGAEGDRPSPWEVMFREIPTPDFLRVPVITRDRRRPPRAAEVEALEELEDEAARFVAAGRAYDQSVRSLIDRELLRRQGRARHYDTALAEETEALSRAREAAIERLEAFLARYPEDPEYTPDTMFRLGELYYEQAARTFHAAYLDADSRGQGDLPLEPDFGPTLTLYRRIAERFPSYRNIDGVYYLIGYCLNEMGRSEEARRAFLAIVCANHFDYEPPFDAPGLTAALPTPARSEREASRGPTGYDPYGDCEPAVVATRFASETWFRVGEHHFDHPREPYAFDFAISAYQHILRRESDVNYDLALYKVAWTYYRVGVLDQAVRRFGEILEFADRYRVASGRSGADLRPEALRHLGMALAHDDWNHNNRTDRDEGLPSGVARASDPNLIRQDRSYTFEVLARLGLTYHEEARFDLAIEAWRAAVTRFAAHPDVPRTVDWIAKGYRDAGDSEAEIETLAELARYVEGSAWWRANGDQPGALQRARDLAEGALMRTAFHYHEEAQRLRRGCLEREETALCDQARALYDRAADSYRGYIRSYPNDPDAYDLHYNLAETMFWSERYEEAAVEYRAVRDSNRDDRFQSEAARRVVESLSALIERAVDAGRLSLREEAPEVEPGEPSRVRPATVPDLVAQLAQAREHYVLRIADENDEEGVRPAFAYNNALLLYQYGYWPQARARLVRILDERCSGARADASGEVAWQTLRNMAIAVEDTDEIRRLGLFLEQRACTFQPDGSATALNEQDCRRQENRNNPQCLHRSDLNALVYRDALGVFDRAERAEEAEQRGLYERSAAMLVEAVERNPSDPQAPIALEQAAIALERTGRFESAGQLYQRIVDEVGPRRASEADGAAGGAARSAAEEQRRLDAIVANAYFRLAFNQNRFFDFDRAVQTYRVLADSPRFSRSADPRIQEKRTDALVNSAVMLERLQRYDEAIDYFRRVVDTVSDPELSRNALYRIAEIQHRRDRPREAIRAFRDFIARYGGDRSAGELLVQAQFRLSEIIASQTSNPRQSSDYRVALQDVLNAFRRSNQAPGSVAAEYAAQARFLLDDNIGTFEGWAIDVGSPATIQEYSQKLARSIRDGSAWAQQLHRLYEPVLEYRRPNWTIATYVRQGRIYEILANAVLNAPFVVPRDIQQQLRRVGSLDREDIRLQVEDQVRQMLDEQARPLECVAVARYALAARAARAGSLDTEFTRLAIDRLQTYGEERIVQCIEQARARDASFEPYRPGEFARAARGQHLETEPGRAAPPLTERVE